MCTLRVDVVGWMPVLDDIGIVHLGWMVALSLRLKDLLGPVTRVKKKKKT